MHDIHNRASVGDRERVHVLWVEEVREVWQDDGVQHYQGQVRQRSRGY